MAVNTNWQIHPLIKIFFKEFVRNQKNKSGIKLKNIAQGRNGI